MGKILKDALAGGYAVGYFEPWDQYSTEAVVQAAENMDAPVIIGCGGIMMDQEWFDGGGMEALSCIGRVSAEHSSVPTALLLNEVSTLRQIEKGLEYGFKAVMLDSSHLPFEENVRITKRVVEAAHAVNVDVEAEYGHLPLGTGKDEKGKPFLTDPEGAADFVARTKVDALAVSVGNIHVLLHGKTDALDLDRLKEIHRRVDVPLVIHGSTGFPDDAVPKVISLGVAKFNVGSALKRAFWTGLKEALEDTPAEANPQHVIGSRTESDVLKHARDRVREEVERLIALYMGRG
jgi:ketose-bisphosphate aldolase